MLSPARAVSAPFVPELLSDYFFVDDRNDSGTLEEDQFSDDDSFYLSGDESEVKQQSSSFVSSPEFYGAQIQPEPSQTFKHAGRRSSSNSGVNYSSKFPAQYQFPTQFNSYQFRTVTNRNTRPQSQPSSPILPLLRPRQIRAHSLAPATRDGLLQMTDYPNRPYSGNDGEHDYVGPFILGPELGRGCSGTVRLGTHRETGFEAAFKIIDKKCLNGDVKLWKKLKREIAILKLIEHPHILKLYDVLETESRLYLVLEHVKGGELFDYIVSKGRLNRDESLRITAQIIRGLQYCHAHSIAHRDLKPENLLLDEDHNVKIADFGMAQLMRSDSILRTSCGSPHYASPEIIEGHDYDAKVSDVWSIGVILYALITGSLPFDHDNIPTLLQMVTRGQYTTPAYVPSDISDLISKMLTVDPARRIRLHQIKKHSCYAGTHYFDIQRTQSWPYLSNLIGGEDSDVSDSEIADEPSTVYRQSSVSTSSRSGLGIYSRRSSIIGADSDDDTHNVDEGVLKDLEALGLGRDSTREELKQKVTGKSVDGEPTVERKFYTLLKQRRNSRLEQLSVLSPKVTRRLNSRRVSISDVSSENDSIPRFDLSSSLPSTMLSSSVPPAQPLHSQHARSATYNDSRYMLPNEMHSPHMNSNQINHGGNNSHTNTRSFSHSDPQSTNDPLLIASAVSLPFIDSFKGFLSVNS